MTDNRTSKLTLYSLGIVVADKARGSDNIQVYPVEELPMVNGNIAEHTSPYKIQLPDSNSIPRKTNVEGKATITAKWLPFGQSNRITSPDVAANETVILFRYADTDEYHWTTLFREPSLRKLETACYMFGDKPGGGFDKSSSYWAEVSTHDQHVQIHTAQSNGEPYVYDIIIDTQQGLVTIKDDQGNTISLNSHESKISIVNAEGSTVEVAKSNINLKAQIVSIDSPQVNVSGNLHAASVTEG